MRPAVTWYLSIENAPLGLSVIDTCVQQLSCAAAGSPVSPAPHVSPPAWPVHPLNATHLLSYEHASDAQSPCAPHALPSAHFGAFVPPQSTSVSSPFFTPSSGA